MHLYPKRAALEGAETEIFKLLSYGATPEQWADWLRAPLEHAAARGNLDLVNKLLEAGASGRAGWRGCRGRTLLDAAALGGNPDVVSAVLRAGCRPDLNVVSVSSRRSALHLAVVCGHEAAAGKLILVGAVVNIVDPADKCFPLHIAAAGGHQQLVRDLLIGGASPDARDVNGYTPLHVAARMGHEKVAAVLLDTAADKDAVTNNARFSPLFLAAKEGRFSTVETLLTAGADAALRTNGGSSPLSAAACYGHIGVMKVIIGSGVDVNAADSHGYTALHGAAHSDRVEAVNVLLDSGADVNIEANSGATPLHSAAGNCHIESTLALLRRGANVESASVTRGAPLHRVCLRQQKGAAATVDLLLRWGASETVRNGRNHTPADVLHVRANARQCSADEAEHIRVLLARAPADRAWRRRCWVVMLRSRAERERIIAHRGAGGAGGRERDEGDGMGTGFGGDGGSSQPGTVADGPGSTASNGGRDQRSKNKVEEGLIAVVSMVVGLESEGVFRCIIGFM